MFRVSIVLVAVLAYFVSGRPGISEDCLHCICEGRTQCNENAGCWYAGTDVCGPFGITYDFWNYSGKPVINGESPDSPDAFKHCANDIQCATLSVKNYMELYEEDCNGNGKIDCNDFALIHWAGGGHHQCKNFTLPDYFSEPFEECLEKKPVLN